MSYPDNCIRGITNKEDYSAEDGVVASTAFHFNPRQHTRQDGWVEQSINWQDDKEAIDFTLFQCKPEGRLKFQVGIAIVPRIQLDGIKRLYDLEGRFAYERQEKESNKYHGNLLLHVDVSLAKMKLLAAAIALAVSQFLPQNN
jgi:hypothetical protein